MRVSAAAVVFVGLIAGFTQSAVDDSSISFGGVTLQIGESQEAAMAALRRWYRVDPAPVSGAFFFKPIGNPGAPGGSVSFKDGKLMTAVVNWLSADQQTKGVPFADALYGAVRQVAGDSRSCTVQAKTSQDPSLEQKGVFVVCGGLQIWSSVFTDGSGKSAELDTVLGGANPAKGTPR